MAAAPRRAPRGPLRWVAAGGWVSVPPGVPRRLLRERRCGPIYRHSGQAPRRLCLTRWLLSGQRGHNGQPGARLVALLLSEPFSDLHRGQGYSLPNAARRASPAVLGCSSGICISNSGHLDLEWSLLGWRLHKAGSSALVLRERCQASLPGVRCVAAPRPAGSAALTFRSAHVSSSYASLSLFPWRFGHRQGATCVQSRQGTVLCGSCWHQGRSNGCRFPRALHRRASASAAELRGMP